MNSVISGKVIEGDKVGKTLGFPTANLDTKDHGLEKAGVYCGYATVGEEKYQAVLCVNWQGTVEVHIIGFNTDIYGKTISVEVVKFIRTMERIDDTDLLKETISKDVATAKAILVQ